MEKHLILAIIIISAGLFGGLVRLFNSIDTTQKINWKDFIKYILTGIGASILIPLFLNMISSDLIKAEPMPILNYFIFSGFCFIGAYLSDKFLTTIGEKVLNQVKNEVNSVKRKQESTNQTVDLLVDSNSEPADLLEKDKSFNINTVYQSLDNKIEPKDKGLINDTLEAFAKKGNYQFRTIKGISKELSCPENVVTIIIKTFEDFGLIKKIRQRDDGYFAYGLTSRGKSLKINYNKRGS